MDDSGRSSAQHLTQLARAASVARADSSSTMLARVRSSDSGNGNCTSAGPLLPYGRSRSVFGNRASLDMDRSKVPLWVWALWHGGACKGAQQRGSMIQSSLLMQERTLGGAVCRIIDLSSTFATTPALLLSFPRAVDPGHRVLAWSWPQALRWYRCQRRPDPAARRVHRGAGPGEDPVRRLTICGVLAGREEGRLTVRLLKCRATASSRGMAKNRVCARWLAASRGLTEVVLLWAPCMTVGLCLLLMRRRRASTWFIPVLAGGDKLGRAVPGRAAGIAVTIVNEEVTS